MQVPAGHTWDDARDTDEALQGQALNDVLAAIGRANPKQLAGVFERTDFNNKMALPSDDLARIVEHFHELGPLGSTRVSTDMLGQAYEWLIAKFAAASGKGGGEFYTPAEVGKLMAGLLEPQAGDRIYDPTCGSGGLLLQCLARAEAQGANVRSLFVYGQELNPETWAIARMNAVARRRRRGRDQARRHAGDASVRRRADAEDVRRRHRQPALLVEELGP